MDPYQTIPLAAPALLPAGTLIGGRFVIRQRIAQTAMSSVYQAVDTRTNQLCVVKQLTPSLRALPPEAARRAFLREAHTLACLEGPFPRLITLGRDAVGWYAIQEFIAGETLAQRLAAGPLAIDEALALAVGLIEALALLHRRGLVYADLHPRNVIVRPDGGVVLIDMGLARPGGVDVAELRGLGTPGYAPPEQAAGQPLDAAADVYALSIVLSEMLDEADLPAFLRIVLDEAQAPLRAERRITLADLERALRLTQRARRHRLAAIRRAVQADRRRRALTAWLTAVLALVLGLAGLLFISLALAG